MSALESLSLEELQAQFKAVQKKSVSQQLTERNCVEIIMKLIEQGELDVLFTLNGREYLTPKQLEREIQDELLQHGGRVNVMELQPILNVDSTHIEKKVDDLIKKNKSIHLVEGELVANYYLDGIAEEINEMLQESGETSLDDLARKFNFGSEYIESIVQRRMGRIIHGKLEDGILYTEAFVRRVLARVRAVFTAITKPTPLVQIISKYGFQEKLFYSILEQLLSQGTLNGSIQGRQDRGIYVPNVFSHARQAWIDSFFNQNGYIDYATLEKLQVTNPRNFLESKYKGGVALKTVYVGSKVITQVDGVSSEAIKGETWIDVSTIAPSVLSNEDMFSLLQACPSVIQMGKNTNCVVLEHQFVTSKALLDRLLKLYEQSIKEKIEKGIIKKTDKDIQSEGKSEMEEEDSKKRGGKRGKSKVAEKKNVNKNEEVDKETIGEFKKWLEDAPDEFVEAIIVHLRSSLNSIKEQLIRALFVPQETKQKKNSFEDDLNTLYSNILLFQKSIQELKEDEPNLEKHLLKTLCTDLTNLIVSNQAEYNMVTGDNNKVDIKAILPQLPKDVASLLQKLNASLTGKNTEGFLVELENVAEKLQYNLKKLDKKREKQLLQTHRLALMDQLSKENNPATCFHLVLVLLFIKKHSAMIHCAGRTLSILLTKLKGDLPESSFTLLSDFQSGVTKFLVQKQADPALEAQLKEKLPQVKELVLGKEDKE